MVFGGGATGLNRVHQIRLHGPWMACEVRPIPGDVWRCAETADPWDVRMPGMVSSTPAAGPRQGEASQVDARSSQWAKTGMASGTEPTGCTLRLTRNFNRPTGLDHRSRLWLGCWCQPPPERAWLNGTPLALAEAADPWSDPMSPAETTAPAADSSRRAADERALCRPTVVFQLPLADLKSYNCLQLVFQLSSTPDLTVRQLALGISIEGA